MDQLSAHLDRGWDLAQKGDAAGASACAKRALELDSQSPEVHNLLGYAAALTGDPEEALEHYKQAIALDETYLEAMLNAVEVLMHPLEEWDEALALCDDALDYAETKEEIADCILLRVDALIGKGDIDQATKCMSQLPDPPFESPSYLFMIGRSLFELGNSEQARPFLEQAVEADASNSDAFYFLGMTRDLAGDPRGAIECFLRARAIDSARPEPPWAPSADTFAELVRRVITSLDALLSRWVRDADVYIVDMPGAELVVDGVDPRAMVLIDARPIGDDDSVDMASPTLDAHQAKLQARLFVYQRNVQRGAGSLDAMVQELTAALEREITEVFLECDDPSHQPDKLSLN